MTAKSNDPREELNKIAKLLVDDLLNATDAEILEEAENDKSLADAATLAKEAFKKATQKVGSRRLHSARAALELEKNKVKTGAPSIDAAMAHRVISKLTAANDSLLTLAARNLKNISDSDAIELVKELYELGAIKTDDESQG